MTPTSLRPTPLEIAVGSVLGEDDSEPPLDPSAAGTSPRGALERALRGALEQPPCVIAFSGGLDSSLLLAVAVVVARRDGLPSPVPVSARFANAPGAGEAEWQELVVGHLGLDDWVRLGLDDELDLVGPVARRLLRRHGVLHPPHTSLFALLAERVPCRTLVTGFGGDQLGAWIGERRNWRLSRQRTLRTAAVAAYAAAPGALRRLALRRQVPGRPWLTAEARDAFAHRWLAAASSEPGTWEGYVGWLARRRTLVSVRRSLDLVLAEHDIVSVHPLLDRPFLAALARAGGKTGLGDRETLFRRLASADLPDALLARTSKAHFQHAYFRHPSRAFAGRWDGSGLDPALVQADELRRTWLARMPRGSSALALQAAWLASEGGDASGAGELDQQGGCLPEKLQATRAQ